MFSIHSDIHEPRIAVIFNEKLEKIKIQEISIEQSLIASSRNSESKQKTTILSRKKKRKNSSQQSQMEKKLHTRLINNAWRN